MIDEAAEELALAAFVRGKMVVQPEWFTGVRVAVALVFQERGAPASPEVASLWLSELNVEWPGLGDAFTRELPPLDGLAKGLACLAVRRNLVKQSPEMTRLAQSCVGDLAAEAQRLVSDALAPLAMVGSESRAIERVKALVAGDCVSGWPILWSPVMSNVVGNVGPDYMMSVGGLPGAGKTIWALQTALDLARQGVKVAFCSADMGAERVVLRAVSALSGVPYRVLRSGKATPLQRDQASKAIDELIALPFECLSAANVFEIAARAKIHGWQALFFDFIQKAFVPGLGRQTSAESVMAATRALSALVGKTFVCLVSQRDQYEDRLKWSSAMQEDSDVVLLLDRDEDLPLVKATLTKNRDGSPNAEVPYFLYPPTIRLVELNETSVGFDV